MMYKFAEKLPPRDPNFHNLSVDIAMLLDTGFMATGFVRFDDDGQVQVAIHRPDEKSRYEKCKAVSWRPLQDADIAEWKSSAYTAYELKLIADNYPTATQEFFERRVPGKSYGAILATARKMGVFKDRPFTWTEEEKQIIRKLYPTTPTAKILEIVGGDRSISDVNHIANSMGLVKINF